MDDLLKLAIEAHGGLERWRQFNVVRANASITGALWHFKAQPDVLKNVQVVAQHHPTRGHSPGREREGNLVGFDPADTNKTNNLS
jgi:hypothetical protein